MPVIKSAIKKLRKDIKREKRNALFRAQLNKAVSVAKKQKTEKLIRNDLYLQGIEEEYQITQDQMAHNSQIPRLVKIQIVYRQ